MKTISGKLVNAHQAHAWLASTWIELKPYLIAGHQITAEFFDGKTREQERLYHSVFADIARDCKAPMVGKADAETWKRLMVDAFYRATKDDDDLKAEWANRAPKMVPNLDGTGFVTVEIQTRRFTKKLAQNFITFLHAWGDEMGVKWSPTSLGREWSMLE